MKSYQIIFNQKTIEYDVIYKHKKNISMRVRNGRLQISVPYHTPLSYIEECIQQYAHKLLPQIEQYQSYFDYRDQGYVYIFHQKFQIIHRSMNQKLCQQHDHCLYVYHQNIQVCVEDYLKKILYAYIQEKVIEYLAYDFDLDMPSIEIKKYKGRWGSCYYKNNQIRFNLSLVHLEKELIDYVIVHELTHFLQPNHSTLFYQEIEKRMPDYKERQKRLKEKHI